MSLFRAKHGCGSGSRDYFNSRPFAVSEMVNIHEQDAVLRLKKETILVPEVTPATRSTGTIVWHRCCALCDNTGVSEGKDNRKGLRACAALIFSTRCWRLVARVGSSGTCDTLVIQPRKTMGGRRERTTSSAVVVFCNSCNSYGRGPRKGVKWLHQQTIVFTRNCKEQSAAGTLEVKQQLV